MALADFHGRIVDAHNHPDWHGHDLLRYLANMDAYGIARTWLLAWESPVDEYEPGYNFCTPYEVLGSTTGPIPFARCLSYAERAPGRFILGYAPDPRRIGAVERMRAAIEIYGVRLCGEMKLRMMYDNPDALALFRFCGSRGVPVTLHIDYPLNTDDDRAHRSYWYGGGIDALERVLQRCPETVFLGHAPGFWSHISGDDLFAQQSYPKGPVQPDGRVPELLRHYPNLYGDLSAGSALNAISRDREFGREFLLEFQDRLLYARDCFDNAHQDYLASLELPDSVLEKLLFGNAEKLVDTAVPA